MVLKAGRVPCCKGTVSRHANSSPAERLCVPRMPSAD